jgi:membrane-bound inhibitor of C-type lysozyme
MNTDAHYDIERGSQFRTTRRAQRSVAIIGTLLVLTSLTACEHKPTKEEEDAAKNTFVCQLVGERLVIRFDSGEARMLTSGSEKITLYQIPSASGVRYSNGNMELRGKGADLVLIENGISTTLDGCKPLTVPKP